VTSRRAIVIIILQSEQPDGALECDAVVGNVTQWVEEKVYFVKKTLVAWRINRTCSAVPWQHSDDNEESKRLQLLIGLHPSLLSKVPWPCRVQNGFQHFVLFALRLRWGLCRRDVSGRGRDANVSHGDNWGRRSDGHGLVRVPKGAKSPKVPCALLYQ
jgi:hypothetical protein